MGCKNMLDQTMKTSSNLKWIWSFAFYIDGSWRELNMLGRTMEIRVISNEYVEKETNTTETWKRAVATAKENEMRITCAV